MMGRRRKRLSIRMRPCSTRLLLPEAHALALGRSWIHAAGLMYKQYKYRLGHTDT